MSPRVVTTPHADDDILTIDAWWRENRLSAPGLFAEELTEAMGHLALIPEMGRRYRHPRIPELHRIVLRSTRYHVYYVLADDLVTVLAVWSAVRGRGPKLPRP